METRTGTETIPLYDIYTMLGVDATMPGAADKIRKASLGIVEVLRTSPAHVAAVIKAGEAAQKYARLQRVQ